MKKEKKLSSDKLKELLRLKFNENQKHRDIALLLHISSGTVSNYAKTVSQKKISWDKIASMKSDELYDLFRKEKRPIKKVLEKSIPVIPLNYEYILRELKHKGVTLQLLWEEYALKHKDEKIYSYSQFCRLYKRWAKRQSPTMRQIHRAGEKMFVDYSGKKVPVITDTTTGKIRMAEIFIAVLGCSNYTYVEATWTQKMKDWIHAHIHAFEFFGGVTTLVIPDYVPRNIIRFMCPSSLCDLHSIFL